MMNKFSRFIVALILLCTILPGMTAYPVSAQDEVPPPTAPSVDVPMEIVLPTALSTEIVQPIAVSTEIPQPTAIPTEISQPTVVSTEVPQPTAIPTEISQPTTVSTEIVAHTNFLLTASGFKAPFDKGRTFMVTGTHNRAGGRHALDFGMANQNVLAMKSGTIVYAGWDSTGGGNIIRIDHGDGTYALYLHLASFYKTSGGVNQGNLIAKSGNTGNGVYHLHVAVKSNSVTELPIIFDEVGRELIYGDYLTSANESISQNPVPAITSLSPNTAVAGREALTLTVNGSNFVNGAVVKWNDSDLVTTFVSTVQLTAIVPSTNLASSGSASVTVFNPTPGGGASNAIPFTITPLLNPVPVIISISPSSAVAGREALTLTVNGSNFVNGTIVKWNGSDLVTTFVSAVQLTATVPSTNLASSGNASVTVFNPTPGGGTSNAIPFTITLMLNPVPVINPLSPSIVLGGSIPLTLTVNGSNFIPLSKVRWNGSILITTFVSDKQLTAIIPSVKLTIPGRATVTVANPTPGGGISNPRIFTIIPYPVPVITSISPSSSMAGNPLTLTVNGSNFTPLSKVRWNGINLETTIVSDKRLTAIIPPAKLALPGKVTITVYNPPPGGGTSNGVPFTITPLLYPVPIINPLSPSTAMAGSGPLTLTVNGSNFIPLSKVRWNGAILITTFVSDKQLTAIIPAAKLAVPARASVTVFNPTPGGGISNVRIFTILPFSNPVPAINSLSPDSATVRSEPVTLTVNGSNFINRSVVRWNDSNLVTTFVSSVELAATIPTINLASSGSASITVINPSPGGGTSSPTSFTVTPNLNCVYQNGVSTLSQDQNWGRANLRVCADNLAGNTIYVNFSRDGREWEYNQNASSNCVTFEDMDGAGPLNGGTTYYSRVSMCQKPDPTWPIPCAGFSSGRGLCDSITVPQSSCTPGKQVDKTAFFTAVASRLSTPAIPAENLSRAVQEFLAWETWENTDACWNPLATTLSMNGSTSFNGSGVQNYADFDTGVHATADTLIFSGQGNYYASIRTMMAGQGFDEAALTSSLNTWGTCTGSCPFMNRWKEIYASTSASTFQWPWTFGQQWQITQGPHSTNLSGLDMNPRGMSWGESAQEWVVAAAAGTVVEASNCFVKIQHANGWSTGYVHMGNVQVSQGSSVNKNDRIGIIGTNQSSAQCGGFADGPHLHFKLYKDNVETSIIGTIFSSWTVGVEDGYTATNGKRSLYTKGGVTKHIFELLDNQ